MPGRAVADVHRAFLDGSHRMVEHFVGLWRGLAPTASRHSARSARSVVSSRYIIKETIGAGVDGCWHFQIGIPLLARAAH